MRKIFSVVVLFDILILLSTIKSIAQKHSQINMNLGFPETVNIGLLFQKENQQFGISGLYLPLTEHTLFSFSTDYYYHFAGNAELSDRKPWYFRVNLNYYSSKDKFRDGMPANYMTDYEKLVYCGLRAGRDFNLSEKLGFGIDLGPEIRLFKKTRYTDWFDFSEPFIPGLGIHFFYKFN